MALPECASTTRLSKQARRHNIRIAASVDELHDMQGVHAYIASVNNNEPIEKLRIQFANEAADNDWRDVSVYVRYMDTKKTNILVPQTTTIPKAAVEPKGMYKGYQYPHPPYSNWSCGNADYVHDTKLVSREVTQNRYEVSYWE
jgi:hypothetical protein